MKKIKVLTICLFFLGFFSAGVVALAGMQLTTPLDENRSRTTLPEGNAIGNIWQDTGYATEYETWFNDNYPLRDLLIKSKNQLDFTLFRRSDELYFAQDGNLLYYSELKSEVANERISDAAFEDICSMFEQVATALEEKGVAFYVMVAPQQNTFYPVLSEGSGISRPENNRYWQLIEYLDASEVLAGSYVDITAALETANALAPATYYKTDFHWNPVAASWAYNYLIEAMEANQDTGLHWMYDIIVEGREGFRGGQVANLAKFRLPDEVEWTIKRYWPSHNTMEIIDENHLHYTSTLDKDNLLPKTMVFGNSFTLHYAEHAGLYDHFEESCFYHTGDIGQLEQLESGTEIVVLQLLEQDMHYAYKGILQGLLDAIDNT